MADILKDIVTGTPKRLRDMGDGSFAEVVAGTGYMSEVIITRPQNATPYTAWDVIGNADGVTPANAGSAVHELTNIGPVGGSIIITAYELMKYVASAPAGMGSYTAYFYNAAPTAILDNAPWSLLAADRTASCGKMDLGTPVGRGVSPTTLVVEADQLAKQFKLAAGSTSLWVELVTNASYTPTSASQTRLRFHSVAA